MDNKKVMKEEDLKGVSGGSGVRTMVNTSGAVAKTGVSYSGGDWSPAAASTMVETKTAGTSSGKGFFAKLMLHFKKKSAKNITSGKNATVVADNKNMMA